MSVTGTCPEDSQCRQGLLWVIVTTLCSPYTPSSTSCGVAGWLCIGIISFEHILGVEPDWILGPQWHNSCSFKNLLSLLHLAGDSMFNCRGALQFPLIPDFIYSLLTFKTYLYGFCLISRGVLRWTTICSITPLSSHFYYFSYCYACIAFHACILRTRRDISLLLFINLHNDLLHTVVQIERMWRSESNPEIR